VKRVLGRGPALAVLAFLLSGCAHSPKIAIPQPIATSESGWKQSKSIRIELGKTTVDFQDGTHQVILSPWDATHKIEYGQYKLSTSAFKLQALIGCVAYASPSGLRGSPYGGIRFMHVSHVGFDFGFDRDNFSAGADWLYHAVAFGPSIMFPYLMYKDYGMGVKVGVIF